MFYAASYPFSSHYRPRVLLGPFEHISPSMSHFSLMLYRSRSYPFQVSWCTILHIYPKSRPGVLAASPHRGRPWHISSMLSYSMDSPIPATPVTHYTTHRRQHQDQVFLHCYIPEYPSTHSIRLSRSTACCQCQVNGIGTLSHLSVYCRPSTCPIDFRLQEFYSL